MHVKVRAWVAQVSSTPLPLPGRSRCAEQFAGSRESTVSGARRFCLSGSGGPSSLRASASLGLQRVAPSPRPPLLAARCPLPSPLRPPGRRWSQECAWLRDPAAEWCRPPPVPAGLVRALLNPSRTPAASSRLGTPAYLPSPLLSPVSHTHHGPATLFLSPYPRPSPASPDLCISPHSLALHCVAGS